MKQILTCLSGFIESAGTPRPIAACLITTALIASSGRTLAQSVISVGGAQVPYANFQMAGSDRVKIEFVRPTGPSAAGTVIPMELPAIPMASSFSMLKDTGSCAFGGEAQCAGSLVTADFTNFTVIDGEVEIVSGTSPAETPGSADFVLTVVNSSGNWNVGPTVNAAIQSVHAVPNLVLDYPPILMVNQSPATVTIDATGSGSVYEPSGNKPPVSFSFVQTKIDPFLGTTVNLVQTGAKATFDAAAVLISEVLTFEVTVDDGTFQTTKEIEIKVGRLLKNIDLVLAIDTSGSMGWHREGSAHDLQGGCCSRLASAKSAGKYFLERLVALDPLARFGVAIFPGAAQPSTDLGIRFSPSSGLADKSQLNAVLGDIGGESIGCGSCLTIPAPGTAGSPTGIPINWNGTPTKAGLLAAHSVMKSAPPSTDHRRAVVLLSDGAWTQTDPLDNPGNAAFLIANFRNSGIPIYTIGMGNPTADEVNHASLQDIANFSFPGGPPGGPPNPFGFLAYDLGDKSTEPNLVPHFEKILAAVTGSSFIGDPSATIGPGETQRHPILVSSHDSLLSATVSWESSAKDLLEFHLLDPLNKRYDAQTSGNSYLNVTIDEQTLKRPESVGQWTLVVSRAQAAGGGSDLLYNYSVMAASSLRMLTALDDSGYATGQDMLLQVALFDDANGVKGAEVVLTVERPDESYGAWQARNMVSPPEVLDVPDQISGEPFDLLAKKNHVLKAKGTLFPPTKLEPAVSLKDDGLDGDVRADDGVYVLRYDGFDLPGVYEFTIRASGMAANGEAFTRETELHRFVKVALTAESLADSISFHVAEPGPLFPDELVELMNEPPPPGSMRLVVVLRPRDATGNLWGPGYAREIEFSARNVELMMKPVDLLDGAYAQVIEFVKGSGPAIEVTAGEVASGVIPVPEGKKSGQGEQQDDESGLPRWLSWLLGVVGLLIVGTVLIRLLRR